MCLETLTAFGNYVVAAAIAFGAWAAHCGIKVARQTLRLNRFHNGASLLDGKKDHVVRYSGALLLIELATQHREEYEERVAKGFLAFLKHPPCFGGTRETDYESVDTVAVKDFLNSLSNCRREQYSRFEPEHPFMLDDGNRVVPNPHSPCFTAWLKRMNGRNPYDPSS